MTHGLLEVEPIKQFPGVQQVTRAVKVMVPAKHFPQLQVAKQRTFYEGTVMEYAERHKFDKHPKAWGTAHTGPVCFSYAIDNPSRAKHK